MKKMVILAFGFGLELRAISSCWSLLWFEYEVSSKKVHVLKTWSPAGGDWLVRMLT
jgi:hypothetical protein